MLGQASEIGLGRSLVKANIYLSIFLLSGRVPCLLTTLILCNKCLITLQITHHLSVAMALFLTADKWGLNSVRLSDEVGLNP